MPSQRFSRGRTFTVAFSAFVAGGLNMWIYYRAILEIPMRVVLLAIFGLAVILPLPAWDFKADGWLHGRMAILRGVESGFSIARSPKEGILTVSDDRGRVLTQRDSKSAPFTTLVARVPVRHTETIYARFGDWFAWLNIFALIALVAEGRIRRRLN